MPPAIPSPAGLPPVPTGSSTRRRAYDREALDAIAGELGQPLSIAPFQFQGRPVWRLAIPIVPGPVISDEPTVPVSEFADVAVTVLTFWLSLGRVDATGSAVSVVAIGIVAVDLVPGVEAIFRYPGGSLTIARNGRIMVRTGPTRVASTPADSRGPGTSQR